MFVKSFALLALAAACVFAFAACQASPYYSGNAENGSYVPAELR